MRLRLRSHMPVRGIRVSPERDPESFKVCPPRPLRVASVAGPSGIPSWLASLAVLVLSAACALHPEWAPERGDSSRCRKVVAR